MDHVGRLRPLLAASRWRSGYIPTELAAEADDGLRDRDHRPAPPGDAAARAGARPDRSPDAVLGASPDPDRSTSMARPPTQPAASARRDRRLPRRARSRRRVAAPDGDRARRQRQLAGAPLRVEGRPAHRRPASARVASSRGPQTVARPQPRMSQADLLRRVVALDHRRRTPTWRSSGSGSRPPPWRPRAVGLPGAGPRRADRTLAVEHRGSGWSPRACRRTSR